MFDIVRNWFVRHQAELSDFESDHRRVLDRLATELQKGDPDLTFEFGPKEPKRGFVISARGLKKLFQR